jgi:hypothetical protein
LSCRNSYSLIGSKAKLWQWFSPSWELLPASYCFLAWLTLQPWRWTRHVRPKHWSTFSRLFRYEMEFWWDIHCISISKHTKSSVETAFHNHVYKTQVALRSMLVTLGAFVGIVFEFHNTTFESAKERSTIYDVHLGHFMEVSTRIQKIRCTLNRDNVNSSFWSISGQPKVWQFYQIGSRQLEISLP